MQQTCWLQELWEFLWGKTIIRAFQFQLQLRSAELRSSIPKRGSWLRRSSRTAEARQQPWWSLAFNSQKVVFYCIFAMVSRVDTRGFLWLKTDHQSADSHIRGCRLTYSSSNWNDLSFSERRSSQYSFLKVRKHGLRHAFLPKRELREK